MPGRTCPDSQRCRQLHLPRELCSSPPTCSSTCSSRACARSTWTPRSRTRYVYIAMHPRVCNWSMRQEQDGPRKTDCAIASPARPSDRDCAHPKSAVLLPWHRQQQRQPRAFSPSPIPSTMLELKRSRESPKNAHTPEAVRTSVWHGLMVLSHDD